MADKITVKTNLPDFRRQLAALGTRMERRTVARAAREAAGVLREASRAEAPVLRKPDKRRVAGALKRGIYVAQQRTRDRGLVHFFVGVRSRRVVRGKALDPFYARFLEFGWVRRGGGERLRGGRRRRGLERSRAVAGGARRFQRPFLAPAFRKASGRALSAFNARMERELRNENRR